MSPDPEHCAAAAAYLAAQGYNESLEISPQKAKKEPGTIMQPELIAHIENAIESAAAEVKRHVEQAAKMTSAEAEDSSMRSALNAGRVQTLLEDALLRARLIYGIGPQLP